MKRFAGILLLWALIILPCLSQAATSITTRGGKGQSLTWSEMDTNFSNLRDATDGYAASLGASIASLLQSQTAGTIGFETVAAMNANLAHPANTIALVTNDATSTNNTYWIKIGVPGSGSWQKSSMPSAIPLVNASIYANFATAVAAQGTTLTTLAISAPMSVTTAVSIPSTIKLMFVGNGSINRSGAGSISGLREVRPEYFGAVGDGSHDDTAAIQDAVNSLVATGGTLFFDNKRYAINSPGVTISSAYPINLIGNQSGFTSDTNMPGILVGAAFSGSLIKYTAPSPGTRGSSQPAGMISGLTFYDPTFSGVQHTSGTRGITAALNLNDFAHGTVDRCNFRWIKGSAIYGEFVVMSAITNNSIIGCGNTGQPAVYLPSTDPNYPAQSVNIAFNKIERCFLAAYISILGGATSSNPSSIKIHNNGFEAEATAPATCYPFLNIDANRTQITGNHFNQNTATAIVIGTGAYTSRVVISSGNTFSTTASATPVISSAAPYTTINGNVFSDLRTVPSIQVSGVGNSVSNNVMYYSGGILSTGANTTISGNTITQPTNTDSTYKYAIQSNGDFSIITGNALTGLYASTCGGIAFGGTLPVVTSNSVTAFSASGAIAYRNNTSNAIVTSNTEANNTIGYSAIGIGIAQASDNKFVTGPTPLQGSTSYNYGAIAPGGIAAASVTITDATTSDLAVGSISGYQNGLVVTAVPLAGSVNVYVYNPTGSIITVGPVTVRAKIIKY